MDTPQTPATPSRPVEVIIPVFRDFDLTRACLQSVLASVLPDDCHVTIIDDHSPEAAITEFCRATAEDERVSLLVNEQNLGFVASCNRGFAAHPERDILLLNSDTLVANNWVQRLQECAYREQQTGTVTPFSNNATICSYPHFTQSNPLPELWDNGQLDALFARANAGGFAHIPTAVGFCMYIRRDCLDDTGPFDEDNFGQGYGEECDFSLRALTRGWHSVLAADVFVFHQGSASFGQESDSRKDRAGEVMAELHPEYDTMVSAFVRDDPLAEFRTAVDQLRLSCKPEDAAFLLEESARGAQLLRKRAADQHRLLENERRVRLNFEKKLAAALEKSAWLDKQHKEQYQLAKFREKQLGELTEKHNEALRYQDNLANLLEQSRGEFKRTDAALAEAQDIALRTRTQLETTAALADQLNTEIEFIKQSRSWRYTAWLRKLKGGI